MRKICSLSIVVFLMVGCGHRPSHHGDMTAIDSVSFRHPDSVSQMLVDIEPRLATADDSAYYGMLYTEDITRIGLSLADDSLVSRAIRHFSDPSSADQQLYVRSLLARSRNSYLRSRWPEALRDGMAARRACLSEDRLLRSRVNSVIGEINLSAGGFQQATDCFRQALADAESCGEDADHIVQLCNNMAEAFDQMGKRDSFMSYQRRLSPLLPRVGSRVRTAVRVNQGDYYLRRGDISRAEACLKAVNGVDISKKSSFLLANIYRLEHRDREAEFMWFDAAGASSASVRMAALDSLLKYRPDDALLKDLLIRAYRDTPTLYDADELTSLQQAEHRALQQQRSYRMAIWALSIICLLLVSLLLLAVYHRRRMRLFRRHIHDLNRRYLHDIEDYNRAKTEINRLQQRITAYQDDKHQLQQWDMQDMLLGDASVIALHRMASRGQTGHAESWQALQTLIRERDPRFWMALKRLPELSERELHACLLIRLRFLPTEIGALFAVTPQAVTNLRVRLLQKLFGVQGGAKDFDERIRKL